MSSALTYGQTVHSCAREESSNQRYSQPRFNPKKMSERFLLGTSTKSTKIGVGLSG